VRTGAATPYRRPDLDDAPDGRLSFSFGWGSWLAALGEHSCQRFDRFRNRRFWKTTIPENDGRWSGGRLCAVCAGAADADGPLRRGVNNSLLADSGSQFDQQMETRRDTVKAQVWEVLAKRRDQRIAPAPVDLPRPSKVAVERPRLDELCQRQLLGHRRAVVCLPLRARDLGGEVRWHQQPTEAKRR
jgi:hypothetical protein